MSTLHRSASAAQDGLLLHGTGRRCTEQAPAARDGPLLHWTGGHCKGNSNIEGEKANALEYF